MACILPIRATYLKGQSFLSAIAVTKQKTTFSRPVFLKVGRIAHLGAILNGKVAKNPKGVKQHKGGKILKH